MDNNEPIIEVRNTSIIINQNTYSWAKKGTRNSVINTLKDDKATLREVVTSALKIENKDLELLEDDIILEISKKILTIISERQYQNTLRDKIVELENTLKKPKQQTELDSQENQSQNETNESNYTTNESTLYQWINKEDYDSCAGMLISLGTEERKGLVDKLLRRENGYEDCIKILLNSKNLDLEDRKKLISEIYTMIPEETRNNIFYKWINNGEYSECAGMLKLGETEQKDQFLGELLKQENGYEECIEVLASLRRYTPIYREKIIRELDKMIPEDIRTQISLEELRNKLSVAEENVILLEISEQEVHSEEIEGEEESDKDDLEEFIATLNLEELVSPNPVPDAISKGVEIEMYLEYHKDKNIDEEEEQQQDENKDNNENEQEENEQEENEQEENEERQQNEDDEDIDIESNEDKDDDREQLISKLNQLREERNELDRQILEIDKEIKKCDDAIQYYSRASAVKTKKELIDEIEKKIILRNLSHDEKNKLEQLKQDMAKLIRKLELLRSNSTIPEFKTEYDLEIFQTSKAIRKDELELEAEEVKTKRDEIEREIAEIERKIAEITGRADEKDKQNSERL